MTLDEANTLLTDANIQSCAITLSAIDRLHAEEFNRLEPKLRKISKFSESDIITMTDKSIEQMAYASVPGNGNGVKCNLSVFLNSLRIIGQEEKIEIALNACSEFESLSTP